MSEPAAAKVSGEQRDESATQPVDIDDANDLRSFHFRRLMRSAVTWIVFALLAIGAAIGAGIGLGPVWIGPAVLAVLLVVLLGAFAFADAAAEEAFFRIYAKQRGMSRTESGSLPRATPLLRKGDERKAEEILRGPLADGLAGTLALYTYTDVHYDKNGRHENDYRFTVAMAELPECKRFAPELYCQRKFGFRALERVEDAFRSKERVKLESEALDREYEIFSAKEQDRNWLRQLFSPTFIVWLTDSAPEKFAFELVDGTLCCNVKGHKKSAAELDRMRDAAAAVAGRLRAEALE